MFGFLFKGRRRRKLLAVPLPEAWRAIIDRNVAVFRLLSSSEQERLLDAVKIIVGERPFVGLDGLEISDQHKVTVAAQAALLLLGEEGYYFDRVPTIYVHRKWPQTRLKHALQHGIFAEPIDLVEEGVVIEGQVLIQDEIRLVWKDVLYGGRNPADGENVVLHEFAHHLDSLDGELAGTPPLPSPDLRRRWQPVFDRELAQLRHDLDADRDVFLHHDAAQNRAELFAYATECFFEQPRELSQRHPELFDCLLAFYKTDPRRWFAGAA
jgi:Mlc titration factor MtfA (ptsG expression regulator)